MKKIITIIFLALLSGCAKKHYHGQDVSKEITMEDQIKYVEVNGNLPVKIINSPSKPAIAFTGSTFDLHNIEVDEQSDKVVVTKPSHCPDKLPIGLTVNANKLVSLSFRGSSVINSHSSKVLDLEIYSTDNVLVKGHININKLSLKGSGNIKINKLYSDDLKIYMTDAVSVDIEGKVKLTRLDMSDCAWLRLLWNDSEYLKVTGKDKAFAQIAGKVNTLEVNLQEGSHFNGKFLRSSIAYVKTAGIARADIKSMDINHLNASDQSNIYTYGDDTDIENMSVVQSGSAMQRFTIDL